MPKRLPPDERLEKVMVIRIATADFGRLEDAASSLGIKPVTLARLAVLRVLDRFEAEGPGVLFGRETPRQAKKSRAGKRGARRKAGRKT